jgi:hypothetical protein
VREARNAGRGNGEATQLSKLSQYDNEIYPLANGNAYLINEIDEQLFLLSGDKAQRITAVTSLGFAPTVFALPDGAAYLASSDGTNLKLYHLVGTTATLVREGQITASSANAPPLNHEKFYWSQAQVAMKRVRRLTKDEREPPEPPEDPQ